MGPLGVQLLLKSKEKLMGCYCTFIVKNTWAYLTYQVYNATGKHMIVILYVHRGQLTRETPGNGQRIFGRPIKNP